MRKGSEGGPSEDSELMFGLNDLRREVVELLDEVLAVLGTQGLRGLTAASDRSCDGDCVATAENQVSEGHGRLSHGIRPCKLNGVKGPYE